MHVQDASIVKATSLTIFLTVNTSGSTNLLMINSCRNFNGLDDTRCPRLPLYVITVIS